MKESLSTGYGPAEHVPWLHLRAGAEGTGVVGIENDHLSSKGKIKKENNYTNKIGIY